MVFGSRALIRLLQILLALLGFGSDSGRVDESLFSDSQVALSLVGKSGSDAVRHLRRTSGVSVAWLSRYWCEKGAARQFEHRPGTSLEPDALTKALGAEDVQRYAVSMGLSQ